MFRQSPNSLKDELVGQYDQQLYVCTSWPLQQDCIKVWLLVLKPQTRPEPALLGTIGVSLYELQSCGFHIMLPGDGEGFIAPATGRVEGSRKSWHRWLEE